MKRQVVLCVCWGHLLQKVKWNRYNGTHLGTTHLAGWNSFFHWTIYFYFITFAIWPFQFLSLCLNHHSSSGHLNFGHLNTMTHPMKAHSITSKLILNASDADTDCYKTAGAPAERRPLFSNQNAVEPPWNTTAGTTNANVFRGKHLKTKKYLESEKQWFQTTLAVR